MKTLLNDLPIARNWKDTGVLPLNVPIDSFGKRVQAARSHPYAWTLSSTLTDLSLKEGRRGCASTLLSPYARWRSVTKTVT